ncbi:MAG: hypothetical protein E7661_04790 [Ruminococcaceae bacterium]|nr:hypothetical protein [Oscillospiraceae bacterium]
MKTITKIIIFCLIGVTLLGTLLNVGFFCELYAETRSIAKNNLSRWISTQNDLDRLEGAISVFFDFKGNHYPQNTPESEETQKIQEFDTADETSESTPAETVAMTEPATEAVSEAVTEPVTEAATEEATEEVTEVFDKIDPEDSTEAVFDGETEAVTDPREETETDANQWDEPSEEETANTEETVAEVDTSVGIIYTIKIHDGIIGVFDNEGNLLDTVNVVVITLPIADREALDRGITACGTEELRKILERIA